MALPIRNFKVKAVRQPKIGEKQPSAVEAEAVWDLADTHVHPSAWPIYY